MERILGACRARFERSFCEQVTARLSAESTAALGELAKGTDGFLAELKSDPGRLGLETLLEEIVKLKRAKALGLPADLFGGFSDRLVVSWRARAMASHPPDFAANGEPVRLTLVAALAWSRTAEIAADGRGRAGAAALHPRRSQAPHLPGDRGARPSGETSMLALHLLQSALVFVNTLLVQSILKEPEWAGKLTDADKRGLSPLFWSHANLYGTIEIDMDRHLDLGLAA